MKVSVFGLGKLGLCTAACFAARGHEVLGYDTSPAVMASLRARQNPIQETGLDDLLAQAWPNLKIIHQPETLVRDTDISLIIVPTPSRPDGRFSNQAVETVLRTIAPALRAKKTFHIVDIVSTVMPGSCQEVFRPLLEELTGKVCGKDFGLVYNPEFIALGTVIHDMRHPDYILIGGRLGACKWLATFWEGIVLNNPPVHCMTWLNAELTKILQNVLVTQKVSAANMVGNICERFPGADAQAVLRAIGDDRRIGQAYLQAATAYGGPCFPRDARALSQVARAVGAPAYMAGATRVTNDHQTTNLVNRVLGFLEDLPERTVAVLGLTYKPGTSVCDDSAAIQLVNALSDAGLDVLAYDPSGHREASHCVSSAVRLAESMEECISGAAVVVIAVPWPEFADLDPTWLERANYRPVVLDCWRMYKPTFFAAAADYAAPGLGTG